MRIMLADALCGVPDKCDGIYSCPLRQRGADYPLAPFSQPTLAFSHFADCYRFAVSFQFGQAGLLRDTTSDAFLAAGG